MTVGRGYFGLRPQAKELSTLARISRWISRTFLKRQGTPEDIASAILYIIRDAGYVSGQVLTVDGGRSLNS